MKLKCLRKLKKLKRLVNNYGISQFNRVFSERIITWGRRYQCKKIDAEGDTVIQILVPSDYMSAIIGKGGNIANSIRTIVQAAAYTKKLGRVRINIDSL